MSEPAQVSVQWEVTLYYEPVGDTADLSLSVSDDESVDLPERGIRLWFGGASTPWYNGRLSGIEFLTDARARVPYDAALKLDHEEANRDPDAATVCCSAMRPYATGTACPDHGDNWLDCPDYVVAKVKDRFGLPVRDGGSSYIAIDFCPWCGSRL